MNEIPPKKPGFWDRLLGREGPEPEPKTKAVPDPAASAYEGEPDYTTAAAAGELAPVEPDLAAEEKPPAELAGADLQPVEGRAAAAPIPRTGPDGAVPQAGPAPGPSAPEPDTQPRTWWRRLTEGMRRTSSTIGESVTSLFVKRRLDAAALEELEDVLVRADLGVETAARIASAIGEGRYDKEISAAEVKGVLASEVEKVLAPVAKPLAVDPARRPFVVLMVGVNGSGKTTTIGKLAQKFKAQGLEVMLAAGDTFRAAAIEQLTVWGARTGVPVVARAQGADAAGLAFDALEQARREGVDVLLVDTAGRLQNKTELMAELEKIVRVMRKLDPQAPHATLLVLDATVGQNAVSQVELFRRAAGVTGLVMTKLDGTARGGILVALAQKFGLPVHFIGVGEGVDDLQPFTAREFARAIAGLDEAA